MGLFKRKDNAAVPSNNSSVLAELALNVINDGVMITDLNGIIVYANPAALRMTNFNYINNVVGISYKNILRLCSKDGAELVDTDNPLIAAMDAKQPLMATQVCLNVNATNKKVPISITMLLATGSYNNRIITFRDITKDLEEEGAQAEFISTASHEMRTPVASIEGYLSLALNPQTATIDERAKGYLTAAHNSSVHLGNLFRDLLDTTKLEDGILKPRAVPCDMVALTKQIADNFASRFLETNLKYQFGTNENAKGGVKVIQQVVYGFVDPGFMQEILGNLIENAIKYTPSGGSVWVNTRGDGDKVLINVTDTGIGVSADDLQHIFQKFYRADNTQTRTNGGTGLGLYLVKQRVEAMNGKVWAESSFGQGTTFYVSLPRISADEYERRMIVYRNAQAVQQFQSMNVQQSQINNMKGQQNG